MSEEASYAKELASAAAVELKNLASEITKLSVQNAKLEKELLAAHELVKSRGSSLQTGISGNRKYHDGQRTGRRGRLTSRANDGSGMVHDDFDSWSLDPDDLKMELQARKQRESALEAALAEKEILEDEYRKKFEEAKDREAALENDLANMWVLVAQLKKERSVVQESKASDGQNDDTDRNSELRMDNVDYKDPILKDTQAQDCTALASDISEEEPLVVRLKVNFSPLKLHFHVYACVLDSLFTYICVHFKTFWVLCCLINLRPFFSTTLKSQLPNACLMVSHFTKLSA